MRYWITIIALAAAAAAQAQVARMPNNAGGQIILTSRPCDTGDGGQYKHLNAGYAFARDGTRKEFCWTILDGLVHALWLDDGTRSTWRPSDFDTSELRGKPRDGSSL